MLYLVPSPLSQDTPAMSVLAENLPQVQACKTWIVENAKPARAALQFFDMPVPVRELEIHELKNLDLSARQALIKRCLSGEAIGLMSDAGCPGVADPGSELVGLAHDAGCPVMPLVGPSSILLGLMGSGLNGQNFHFHGYLPVDNSARVQAIRQLEVASAKNGTTQIAIETPFRNQKLLDAMIENLSPETRLCVATDLTGVAQQIHTRTIAQWKKVKPQLGKTPTVFLWLAKASR